MMPWKTALSRCGPMDPGDVRSVPKVDASSVDIFLSAYALWSQVVDGEAIADRGTGIDASYDAAVKPPNCGRWLVFSGSIPFLATSWRPERCWWQEKVHQCTSLACLLKEEG